MISALSKIKFFNPNRSFMKKRTSLQIILIDNDRYVRESLGTFFNRTPIQFLIFKSASEGLNSLKYQKIDVVIADYFLPDMDGLNLLKQVAVQKPGIARILMATIVSEELEKEVKAAGIDAFIEKPLSVASIDRILNKISRRKTDKALPEIRDDR